MSGVRRIFGWIVRTAAIAGLIAVTVLLVWAFESRQMPALGTWHTLPLTGELSTRGATAQGTLQDYLDQEERLFRELRVNIYDRLDALSDPGLPPPDRVLLFSPEIGIAPFSAIANSHKLLSFVNLLRPVQMALDPARIRPFQGQLLPQERGTTGLRNHGRIDAPAGGDTQGRQAGRLSPGAHLSLLGRCDRRDLSDH
jgi:hypothetical protein